MTEEIVKTKKYKRPEVLHCGSCPHCISFLTYGDCENFYCLVDDEYKANDYPEEKYCPFKKEEPLPNHWCPQEEK